MRESSGLVELVQTFARIVERIASSDAGDGSEALHDEAEGWIDQTKSVLGARLHNRAVRRRLEEGSGGAAIVYRRHLLSPAAYEAEIMRSPKPGLRKTQGPALIRDTVTPSTAAATLDRLRRLRGRQKRK